MNKQEHRTAVRDQMALPLTSEIVCLAVVERDGEEWRICGRTLFKSKPGLQMCGQHEAEISAAAHRISNMGQ